MGIESGFHLDFKIWIMILKELMQNRRETFNSHTPAQGLENHFSSP
jgi:hypothetical protein